MAYNWGKGLGSAASGAAMGAAVGGPLAPFTAAAGGLLGLASGFFGQEESQTEQINPYSQSYWDIASQNMANYQKQMGTALGQQEGMIGQAGRAYNQLQNFQTTAQFDPSAAMRMTRSQLPQLQQLAQQSLGEGALNPEATRDRMESAAQQTAAQFNQMGGLGSGAAQGAIGQAVGGIQAQTDLQQQQMYQQAFLGQLGQAYQGNLSGLQQQFSGRQQADQLRFQGISGAASGYAGLGQQYGQRASMFGNLAGQSQASMANMAGTEFMYQPAQEKPIFGGLMDGLGTGLSIYQLSQENQQRQQLLDLMGGGGQQQGPTTNYLAPGISNNPYDNPFINENQTYGSLMFRPQFGY